MAYGSVLQERRRALHARVVEALERLHEERLDEHVEALAHHALLGEAWDRAVRYQRHAGARAARQSASREAVAHLERALAALQRLPERAGRVADGIDLRLELRNALLPLGDNQAMFAHLRAAEELATASGDDRRHARAGRIDDALPVLEFAVEEAVTAGLRFTYARQSDEAARHAATALVVARLQKQRGQEAAALCLPAQVAACALEGERAEADYRHAMALASWCRAWARC